MKNINFQPKNNFLGFTLAEMMVVLLIMAIVLAALAPIITRKFRHQASGGNGEIVWAFDGDHAIANLLGIANKKAIIANNGTENFTDNARLIIQTNGTNTEHISFRVAGNDTRLGKLYLRDNQAISLGAGDAGGAGSISIGNSSVTSENSIVIGTDNGNTDNVVSNQNVILIGNEANVVNNNAIAIGYQAYGNQDCVAIGNGARTDTSLRDSIAIGHEATVASQAFDSLAIGHGASVAERAKYSVAIGRNSNVAEGAESSVAIGDNVKVVGTNSVALGKDIVLPSINTILIGDDTTHVGFGAKKNPDGENVPINAVVLDQYRVAIENGGLYVDGDLQLNGALLGPTNANGDPLPIVFGAPGIQLSAGAHILDKDGNPLTRPKNSNSQGWQDFESDARLKYVGTESKAGLEQIRQLKPFNYTFKKDEKKTPHVGVIAQDLQKVFPDAVQEGDDGFLTIRMEDIFYAVINAIKELDLRLSKLEKSFAELIHSVQNNNNDIKQLKKDNELLKKDNERLKKDNADLKARLDKIEAKLK